MSKARREELFILVDAQEPAAKEISCDACGAAPSERVKNPGSWLGRCLNDSGEDTHKGFWVGCLPQDFSHGAIAGSVHTSRIWVPPLISFINS